jgi:hypothetical protein
MIHTSAQSSIVVVVVVVVVGGAAVQGSAWIDIYFKSTRSTIILIFTCKLWATRIASPR